MNTKNRAAILLAIMIAGASPLTQSICPFRGGIAEAARALTAEEIAERGYPQIPTVVYYDDGTASRPPGYGNGKAGFTHLPIMSYDGDSLVVGSPTKYAYGLNSSGSILGYQVVIKGDCREDTAIPFSAIFVRRKKQAV